MGLTNSQYDAIMRIYEQRQLHNKDILFARYEEVYRKIPELKKTDDAISSLGVAQARKLLSGDEHAVEEFREQQKKLTLQKKALLTSNGYPEDYLEPIYQCSDCHDTGYIGNQKCHCFQKAIIQLLYTQSNLQEILEKENFDTFSLSYYSNHYIDKKTGRSSLALMQDALAACHTFVNAFSTDFRNLFLYGSTGVGKTFLSHCIARELINKSYSVIYFTAFELFDIIAKYKFEKDETAGVMYEHIFSCDLLIIDDLGTELTNSFTSSQLFLCLNERLLNRKSTIISTNLTLDSLVELYSERTFSRITSNYTMLRLTGDDIRIQKKLMNREEH